VRREIAPIPRAAARAALGLDPAGRVLVVLGGSQGAGPLNAWVREHREALAAEGVQLYVVTGMGKGEPAVLAGTARSGVPVRSIFVPFSDRMAELMSAADLVLSRAGAGTLAELVRCGTPAVLVPFPQAADDHQRANAEYFARQGGGVVVPQGRLDGLLPLVLTLLGDEPQLEAWRGRLRELDRAGAIEAMLTDFESLARPDPGAGAACTAAASALV